MNRGILIRFAALAAVAALGYYGAASAASPRYSKVITPPSAGIVAVPFTEIQERVHFTASAVPKFPMDDRLLANPSSWPQTITLGGKKGNLRILGRDAYVNLPLKSLKDKKGGMRLVLYYAREGTDDVAWGPRYSWDARGRIAERIYYDRQDGRLVTHTYTYSRDGSLLGYSWRNEARDEDYRSHQYEYLSEFYDGDGQLIAIAYEQKLKGETTSLYSWNGENVPFDEFRMKSHILYANVAR